MTLVLTLDLVMRDRRGGMAQPMRARQPNTANAPASAANASNAGDDPARRPPDQPVTTISDATSPDQSALVTEDRREPGLRNLLGLVGRPVFLSRQPIIAAVFHPLTGSPHHHSLGADGFLRAVLPHHPTGAFLHHQDPGSGRLTPQHPVLRARDTPVGPVLADREPPHGLSQSGLANESGHSTSRGSRPDLGRIDGGPGRVAAPAGRGPGQHARAGLLQPPAVGLLGCVVTTA